MGPVSAIRPPRAHGEGHHPHLGAVVCLSPPHGWASIRAHFQYQRHTETQKNVSKLSELLLVLVRKVAKFPKRRNHRRFGAGTRQVCDSYHFRRAPISEGVAHRDH